ncbi:MAG: hypothetical protein AAF085_16660, partial [Planctomycetota bacterium]
AARVVSVGELGLKLEQIQASMKSQTLPQTEHHLLQGSSSVDVAKTVAVEWVYNQAGTDP